MKSDIEIAQEAKLLPITEIAAGLNIPQEDLELYGRYKAKLSEDYLKQLNGQPDGKRLDFLVQEMNREANTIGSKANDLEITGLMLKIKAEVEKIREQVQNVE